MSDPSPLPAHQPSTRSFGARPWPAAGSPPPDADLERVVVRKVALRFLPLIGLGLIVLNIDRSNIGVAALTMNQQLGITAAQYGLAAGIYFWGYSLLELPSNMILSRVGARLWLSRIMITWGILTIACGFLITSHLSLYVMRLLVGVAEAGYSPGALFFIALWFPRFIRARMYSMVIACLAASTFFTPAMTALLNLDGLGGISGWQWVFIVTGIPAVILGVVFFLLIRDTPGTAGWLSPAERAWLEDRLKSERDAQEAIEKHSIATALRDPKLWGLCSTYFLICFSFNGYNLWLTQMLKAMGLTNTQVGWFAALPAFVAIVPMLLWLRHSDRTGERVRHFVYPTLLTAVGFAVVAAFFDTPPVAIVGFCLAALGIYSAIASFWYFPASFLTGAAAAAGIGLIHTIANTSGYFGPQVVGLINEASGNFRIGIVALASAAVLSGLVLLLLARRTTFGAALSLDATGGPAADLGPAVPERAADHEKAG